MRHILVTLLFVFAAASVLAQEQKDNEVLPTNEKARKTYADAQEHVKKRMIPSALEGFKKADKQDGGHCLPCQRNIIKYALMLEEWKAAASAADEMIAEAQTPREIALAHYQAGVVAMNEGGRRHKDECFTRAHEEMGKAIATIPNFPSAVFTDGQALAHLKQDEAAKKCFEQYVKLAKAEDVNRQRAQRYIVEPELARARMAPAFAISTIDGKQFSLDDLHGKVVLLDFWATWCGPCREALPHMRKIAQKFQDQPLVVVSVISMMTRRSGETSLVRTR